MAECDAEAEFRDAGRRGVLIVATYYDFLCGVTLLVMMCSPAFASLHILSTSRVTS